MELSTKLESVEGIKKPSIQRILYRAGVRRVNSTTTSTLRKILTDYAVQLVRDTIIFTNQTSRKTLKPVDVQAALEIRGIFLAAGLNKNTKTTSLKSCNSRGKPKKETKTATAEATTVPSKKHRFKPGTVATRNIKKYQKNSDCLAIPRNNFSNLVREIISKYRSDKEDPLRLSSGVSELIQLACEDYLLKISQEGNLYAKHANRETLCPQDIDLVMIIRNNFR